VDTMYVDSRAPVCPTFNIVLRERGPLSEERQTPPIRTRDEGTFI
jgi:hypothetical protein